MRTDLRRLFLVSLAISLGLALLSSCASTGSGNDALLKISVPPMGSDGEREKGAPTINSAPSLDKRPIEDNQLALIEQLQLDRDELRKELEMVSGKLRRYEKTATTEMSRETTLEDDIDRMQLMLQASQDRERDLQRQLLLARLEAVRQEQAAVRGQISGIGSTIDPK